MKIYLILLALLPVSAAYAQNLSIIPQPNQVTVGSGVFQLIPRTPVICNDPTFANVADYLKAELLKTIGLALASTGKSPLPALVISRTTPASGSDEAYGLQITNGEIRIQAATVTGAFYGAISLLQLVRQTTRQHQTWPLPALTIQDSPRYAWRGLLLDESRHFFGKQTVKKLLDWMAFYKLNRFHWHLTDEPGWRIEIRAYPRLTLVGGIGSYSDHQAPARYYTQEDIREVVRYAAERHIVVIPEIDMPGHARAANQAYPLFSGGGSVRYPDFTFNPGQDTTYTYLTHILKETDVLFPAQMIHLGGDEVHFGNENWRTDPHVRNLMTQQKLTSLPAVERYFIQRMADSVFALNNKILLWDEAVDTALPADKTIIFWWRHDQPDQLKKAMEKQLPTVLTPRIPFYLDFVQDSTQQVGRRWKKAFAPLESLYTFSISKLPVTPPQQTLILGVQGALWTEHISTQARLEYMLFPRISALAETAWTQENQKELTGFMKRVNNHLLLYQQEKIYYYNPFNPALTPEQMDRNELK